MALPIDAEIGGVGPALGAVYQLLGRWDESGSSTQNSLHRSPSDTGS